MCMLETNSPCQCVFLDVSRVYFCCHSRSSESPEVLDLASKSSKRDVSLGFCSLNEPPFLMLLKGSTRFYKAKTFSIHQVSIKNLVLGFASFGDSQKRIFLAGDVGEECRSPSPMVASASRKWD